MSPILFLLTETLNIIAGLFSIYSIRYYNRMAYRQRNIPVTSKEESQCQTDIKLLETYLFDEQNVAQSSHIRDSTIKLSEIYGHSKLLRPFSDHHLLHEFARQVKELKDLPYDEKTFGKRLQILQAQIKGLLKRDFLVHDSVEGDEKWNSYYSTLNEKQKEIIRFTRQKVYTDSQILRMQQRIDSLQQETTQLRKALVYSQKALEQNTVFSTFFEKISQIIQTSNQKGKDIELAIQQQVLPLYSETNINIVNINRTINKEVPINIRPFATNLAKEFDRLLKQHQLSEDRLSDLIGSLVNNFKAVRGVQYLKSQFDLAQRAQIAESNYKSMLALFKHEIDSLKQDQPYLKGSEKLDFLLRKLQEENLVLVEIQGWMNLAVSHIKVRESHKQDTKLRQFVGIIAGEFKRIYQKFPELKKHVSQQLVQIIYSEALVEMIDGASIQKLKEIIVHQVDLVRVDNVYQVQKSKDAELILHLRVLIKYLFDTLIKLRVKHNLSFQFEEGIEGLLKELALDCIDTQKIIELFRSPARYVQVPVVVQNIVYETKTFERGIPINRPEHIVISEQKRQVVPIHREVPVFIQKPVEYVINKLIPVEITTQKAVEVSVNRDVIVDRVCQTAVEVPVIRQKVVPAYQREQVIKQIPVDRVVKDLQIRETQRIVELKIQQIVEVEKVVEKAVVCHEFKETIQEVEVRVPYIISKTELKEVERQVPYIVETQRPVEVIVEVPVEIKKQEITFVDVLEFRDRPIVLTNTIEKPIYTELKVEKEIIKQVPKQVFIQRSHFIKGDKEESIREVEVFVDKPIIQEVLVTKDVQIEKIVPLYITEQVPIINEVYVPCVSYKIQEIEVQKIKVVAAKQEIVKPIHVDKPVPIIIEKEVVKVQQQFIDRIIQKIVEVPRVVQVEKIVQKIVVVPRIVEKIVQVPKIIQKIVIVYETVLQIVEVPVPQIVIQEVQVPIQIFVDRIIICKEKEIETVEVQRIVERTITQQKIVQVQTERRIPVEIIKQVPVETYRDRIQYQKVFIHETKVESIEVQVPFIVQQKVPFVVEKEVVIHDIIQQPVYEKIYQEKEKPVIVKQQRLVVKQITVEKPIIERQIVRIPGPETIIKCDQPYEVEVIREKIVKENHYKEKIKEVILQTEKIVPIIHEKIVTVTINELVRTPELIEVPKIVELVHYKEIPVDVPVREERLQTTIVEQIKQVEKRVQVATEVEISIQKIKEIANQIKCFIVQEREKQIYKEVEILIPSETKIVEVPSTPIIHQTRETKKIVELQDKVYQKLVQKIVMLPQIVQVVKHIHHISEVNQLGVAVDVDLNVHVEKYLGVTTELKKGLVQLLSLFRSNVGRQPDLKNLIVIIEKYLKYIDEWIAFPKLVQIEKEVNVEVQKKKVVVVEKENKDKEASLGYIVQKLLNELKRIRQSHKISLALDEDLLKIFFTERRGEDELDKKYEQFQQILKKKYGSSGDWSNSHPFLISSFLQDHFALQNLVDQANRIQHVQQDQISLLRKDLDVTISKSHDLICYNKKLFEQNNALIKILQKYRNTIDNEDYESHISSHQKFRDDIVSGNSRILISTIERGNKYTESFIMEDAISEESTIQKNSYIGQLVSKISKHQVESQNLFAKNKRLQSEITKYTEQLNIKNSIIKRLETDFNSKLSRAKEELSKNPNLTKEITEESKKLSEKIKVQERQFNTEKQNLEKAKRELERALETSKKDATRQAQRREREIKELNQKNKRELDREITRLKTDYDRLRREKEKVDEEIAEIKKKSSQEIKAIREQQLSGATDKNNQLINQNLELRKRSDNLNAEYEKLKKAAAENNSINEKEMNKLKTEIEKFNIEKREWQKQRKVGFMDLTQQTQLVNRNIQLQKKIKSLQAEVNKKNKDETYLSEIKALRQNIKKLELELETTKTELVTYQKMRSTQYQSGYKSGVYSSQYVVESSLIKSPKAGIFKSAEQKMFISPQSVQSREEKIEQSGNSSSRFSQQSSDEKSSISSYKSQMLLRQFMETKHSDEKEKDLFTIFVMIKIIEEVQNQIQKGNYYSYTPNNVNILNFNPKQLDKMTIKFGIHIVNRNKDNAGLYLAPQILAGQQASLKSVVFNLGIILDELIHGSTFFRSIQEIQNMQIQFKVRGDKLNPILKNTLFQMMNKQPNKRLELVEAKRRLSLQKYITSQGRSAVTTTTRRLERRREE